MGCVHHIPPLKVQASIWEGSKAVRANGSTWCFQNFCFRHRCTYGLTEIVTVCTRPAQIQARQKSEHQEEEMGTMSHPNQEAIRNWYLLGEGKIGFIQGSNTGYINHTLGHLLCSGWDGKHKLDSGILVPLKFYFCLFSGSRNNMKLGRYGGKTWDVLGLGEDMI